MTAGSLAGSVFDKYSQSGETLGETSMADTEEGEEHEERWYWTNYLKQAEAELCQAQQSLKLASLLTTY